MGYAAVVGGTGHKKERKISSLGVSLRRGKAKKVRFYEIQGCVRINKRIINNDRQCSFETGVGFRW